MKKLLPLIALIASAAFGQSVPNGGTITNGQVWTTAQWVNAWQTKADTASPAFTGTLSVPSATISGTPTNSVGLSVLDNLGTKPAGVASMRVGCANGTESGWLLNPAAGDFVALYAYCTSQGRNRIWAFNTVVDIQAGNPATAWSAEFDVNEANANAPDPHNTNHALGLDVVSGSTFAPSAPFATLSTTLANRWKHGLWFDSVGGQTGSTLIKANNNISVDYGLDLALATVNFQGVRVGNTAAVVAPIASRQFANNGTGLFLQRFTDTAPTGNLIQAVNAANSIVVAALDASGNYTGTSYVANPASGSVGLTVNGATSVGQQIAISGSSGAGASILYTDGNAGNRVFIAGVSISAVGAFEIKDNTAGISRLKIDSTGATTIAAPSSGTALTVTGVSGQLAIAPSQPVGLPSFTVAGLLACNATLKGGLAYVTDATAPTYNAALTGGGAVVIPVFCNGAAWTAH
jgi:hypothetical protein